MTETYKVWDIISGFARGAFIEGDVFINELGQEIHYDGETVKGLGDLDPQSTWTYVEKKFDYSKLGGIA